jgi:two-component system OmpR family sensor kinase
VSRRWRPSLALVLGGGLAGTLGLSFAGMVTLRYLGPQIGFTNAAVLIGLVILLATAVLGYLLVRLLVQPIRALERFARAEESGIAATPPAHFGTRELHATASRVVAMAETLRDREASIRAHTDHVTHELKSPVAAIRAAVELLADSPALTGEERALLAQIDGAGQQMETQLAALRTAAQARETRYLGWSTLAEVLPALARDGLDVTVEGASDPLPLAAEGLVIVLGHLLRNAGEHGARRVLLRATVTPEDRRLLVADDGSGVSPGNARRIFDPFFTTRRDQGGTGMGLAVVHNILRAHRAGIELQDAPAGAAFLIRFRQG